jgi:hypothetical protein
MVATSSSSTLTTTSTAFTTSSTFFTTISTSSTTTTAYSTATTSTATTALTINVSTSLTTTISNTIASSSLNQPTGSTTIGTIGISIINSILNINTTFDFAQLSPTQIKNILNSSYDLSGCIVNCSNNGLCMFDTVNNKFICSCDSVYLGGYACQIDTRPCSSNPCLNNATCVDYSNSMNYNMSSIISNNSSSFYCLCNEFYKGANCESKIDLCQNETCSNNGNCYDSNNLPKCKCLSMYSGDKCETESNELKAVKKLISLASILAIVIIISFYSCFLLMDITKFLCKKNNRIYSHEKPSIKKFIYINSK